MVFKTNIMSHQQRQRSSVFGTLTVIAFRVMGVFPITSLLPRAHIINFFINWGPTVTVWTESIKANSRSLFRFINVYVYENQYLSLCPSTTRVFLTLSLYLIKFWSVLCLHAWMPGEGLNEQILREGNVFSTLEPYFLA